MATYNLTSISNCYVYGEIDSSITCILNELSEEFGIAKNKKSILGKKNHRRNTLKGQSLSKKGGAVVIFNGDCGFMEKPLEDVIDMLCKYNDMFSNENIHIFFVRGGDENPSWFNSEKISLSNIECVEDYSIILTKHINILCIGGSASINKDWKENKCNNDSVLSKSTLPIYDENKLSNVTSSHYPHVVITPNPPTFILPYADDVIYNSDWIKERHNLIKEIWGSRVVNDKIYTFLTADCTSLPYIWFYQNNNARINTSVRINNILFYPIKGTQILNISFLLKNNFRIDLTKLNKNSIMPNEPNTNGGSIWYESPSNSIFTMADALMEENDNDDAFNDLMNALGGQEENGIEIQ